MSERCRQVVNSTSVRLVRNRALPCLEFLVYPARIEKSVSQDMGKDHHGKIRPCVLKNRPYTRIEHVTCYNTGYEDVTDSLMKLCEEAGMPEPECMEEAAVSNYDGVSGLYNRLVLDSRTKQKDASAVLGALAKEYLSQKKE
ncbi:hypothetical protein JW707_04485 [Candidatus Woesearchaeota archaeon]|nr:hypothetical protein [Candidatus Woesearchaeota archaeon]